MLFRKVTETMTALIALLVERQTQYDVCKFEPRLEWLGTLLRKNMLFTSIAGREVLAYLQKMGQSWVRHKGTRLG